MSEVSQDQSLVQSAVNETVALKTDSGSVGGRLAAVREQRGWTVQYVAEQLKLSQSQILALEADQLDKLPKLVIVRGFVRAYAKLLRMNGDVLVALLPQDSEPMKLEASLRPALSTPFIESRTSLSGHQENNKRYIVGMFVLLIIVAIVLVIQRTDLGQSLQGWFTGSAVKTVPVPEAIPQTVEAASLPASSVQSPDAEVSREASASSSAGDSSVASNAAIQESSVSQQVVEQSVPSSTPVTASVSSASNSVVTAANTLPINLNESLVLKFKHDSWVFVKAEGGAVLSSHLAKAGSEEVFSVKQGLFVKLGNAAGVEAILRGKPLAIVPDRDSKVASVSVK